MRELISTLKKKKEKKSAGGKWIVEHSPQILAREEKATTISLLKQIGQGPVRSEQATLVIAAFAGEESLHNHVCGL